MKNRFGKKEGKRVEKERKWNVQYYLVSGLQVVARQYSKIVQYSSNRNSTTPYY